MIFAIQSGIYLNFFAHRCVLELHAIAEKKEQSGGNFAVAMTPQERQRFLDGILQDHRSYVAMLGNVNAENSECSRPSDRDCIHSSIRDSVGFVTLSRMVFGVMEFWMVGEMQGAAADRLSHGDERGSMEWNCALANVLSHQGRYAEAVVLREHVLQRVHRVLPEDHPDIGDGDRLLLRAVPDAVETQAPL